MKHGEGKNGGSRGRAGNQRMFKRGKGHAKNRRQINATAGDSSEELASAEGEKDQVRTKLFRYKWIKKVGEGMDSHGPNKILRQRIPSKGKRNSKTF